MRFIVKNAIELDAPYIVPNFHMFVYSIPVERSGGLQPEMTGILRDLLLQEVRTHPGQPTPCELRAHASVVVGQAGRHDDPGHGMIG